MVLLVVAACVSLARLAACTLFEDQQGSNNWLLQHVGIVREAALLQAPAAAVVNTREDVLASIRLLDGSVAWRRHTAVELAASSPDQAVHVVSNGRTLSAWDTTAGQLLWQRESGADALCAGSEHAYAVRGGAVSAWALSQGEPRWTSPPLAAKADRHACAASGSSVRVASWSSGGSTVHVTTLSGRDGQSEPTQAVTSAHALERVYLADGLLFAVTAGGRHACSATLGAQPVDLQCVELPAARGAVAVSLAGGGAAVFDHGAQALTTLALSAGAAPRVTAAAVSASAASSVFAHGGKALVATVAVPVAGAAHGLGLAVYDVAAGTSAYSSKVQQPFAVDNQGAVSPVAALWAASVAGSSGSPLFRCVPRFCARNVVAWVYKACI